MCEWNKSVNPEKTAWEERNENFKYVLSLPAPEVFKVSKVKEELFEFFL